MRFDKIDKKDVEYQLIKQPKVKLKGFITSLITGVSLFTASNISPVIAGSCENAPDTGTVFKWTGPDTWKILSTVRQSITSTNERKVEFAYKKLDLKAKTTPSAASVCCKFNK